MVIRNLCCTYHRYHCAKYEHPQSKNESGVQATSIITEILRKFDPDLLLQDHIGNLKPSVASTHKSHKMNILGQK